MTAKPTPKQTRFVREYLIDCNATQAAIRAGFSKKTAYSQGQRLLKKVEISAAVDKAQTAQSKRLQVTADDIFMRAWNMASRKRDKVAIGALNLCAKRFPEFNRSETTVRKPERLSEYTDAELLVLAKNEGIDLSRPVH